MFKNYFKTTLRYFIRNSNHLLINLLGLTIAIGCSITAYVNYDFAVSFDSIHKKSKEIYRLNLEYYDNNELNKVGVAPLPLYDLIKTNISEVENIIRYGEEHVTLKSDLKTFSVGIGFTDPEFFQIFDFEFIHGGPEVLNDFTTLLITKELALKYFGKTDVIEETLDMVIDNKLTSFKVGAVIENPPSNGSFGFEVIANINRYFDYFKVNPNHDWQIWYLMFLHIPEDSKVKSAFQQIDRYLVDGLQKIELEHEYQAYPEPFYGMSNKPRFRSYWLNRGMPKNAVTVPLILSIAMLIIACINFTNTTIAIAGKRLKEIGVKKVVGALQQHLIIQILTETFLISIIALVLGLMLAEILIPVYSNMWPWLDLELTYLDNIDIFIFIIVLLIAISFLAGGYPAFYISSFEPSKIFRGQTELKSANWYIKSLLFFQFIISVIMVVLTIGFWSNYYYQKDFNLGFQTEGIIYHYLGNGDEVKQLRPELNKIPEVKSTEVTYNNIYNLDEYSKFETHDREIRADLLKTTPGYLNIMDIKLLKGRNFENNSVSDQQESILINEVFAEINGWTDPIGKEVIYNDSIRLYVIGIIKNIYHNGFSHEIRPLVIMNVAPANCRQIMIKANTVDLPNIQKKLGVLFKEFFPNRLYNPRYMDEAVKRALEINANGIFVFLFLGITSLLLTSTGLYSLISMNIARRTKEMGIRKVLGANSTNILWQLNYHFTYILIVSLIIGLNIGKYFSDFLLDRVFHYYNPMSYSNLCLSFIIITTVFILSIASKLRNTLRENPVDSLRSE